MRSRPFTGMLNTRFHVLPMAALGRVRLQLKTPTGRSNLPPCLRRLTGLLLSLAARHSNGSIGRRLAG